MAIQIYNSEKKIVEEEKVYGDKFIRFLYENRVGGFFSTLLCKAPISVIFGKMQDAPASADKIPDFIKNYEIAIDDYETETYKNFNQFFIRRFKVGKRNFETNPKIMPAFCEARYFGYESITNETKYPVKGRHLLANELVANPIWGQCFEGGPLVIARLCPVDYHRFHFPDNGKVLDHYKVRGDYHSVNPIALKKLPTIFTNNVREVTILETENFGKLAYIEVGAMCVGKIVQSHTTPTFKRGDEKGYFLFGGSTVVVLGEKDKWKPSSEILEKSRDGIEVYLKLGAPLSEM